MLYCTICSSNQYCTWMERHSKKSERPTSSVWVAVEVTLTGKPVPQGERPVDGVFNLHPTEQVAMDATVEGLDDCRWSLCHSPSRAWAWPGPIVACLAFCRLILLTSLLCRSPSWTGCASRDSANCAASSLGMTHSHLKVRGRRPRCHVAPQRRWRRLSRFGAPHYRLCWRELVPGGFLPRPTCGHRLAEVGQFRNSLSAVLGAQRAACTSNLLARRLRS